MKRSITSLRFTSASALATITRMVCPRTSVASVAARDETDLAFVDLLQAERRRGPADIDLIGHHGGERRARIAGRLRLGRQVELLDEGAARSMLVEEPLVEKAMVVCRWCPSAS